jgi:hypothetical protein
LAVHSGHNRHTNAAVKTINGAVIQTIGGVSHLRKGRGEVGAKDIVAAVTLGPPVGRARRILPLESRRAVSTQPIFDGAGKLGLVVAIP